MAIASNTEQQMQTLRFNSWARVVGFSLTTLLAGAAYAGEVPTSVMTNVAKLAPDATADDVSATPIPGLYEVSVGGQVVYLSEDGRYLLRGDLMDIEERRNLTEDRRKSARLGELSKLDQDGMIVFKAADTRRHRVTVFTDIDCGYCAKLHRQMADYNDLGIEIRYLAFPRAGLKSKSYDKTVSVWCSDDRQEAIGAAKARRPVEARQCVNPVESHYATGRRIGVNGTPTIVTDDGTVIPGYLPPKELLSQLDRKG